LHRDISRLVQLAYPNETGSFLAHEGRNAFIAALEDSDLEYEVLKLESKTLHDAVDHAIRLESLAESVRARSHTAADKAGRRPQSQHSILAVTDENEAKDKNVELQQRVAQLEQHLKQVTQGGTCSAPSSSKKSNSRRSRGRRSADQNATAAGANKPNPQTHPCTNCNKLGHWRRDCPIRKNRPREEAGVQPVLTVSANMSPTKIYVTAEVNGQPVRCLLDYGCKQSVISADLAPKANLNPSQYTLFAANKANLDVLGDTVLPFVIDGHAFKADVSVCSKVEDFLLGSDWLEQQGAQWDFASGTVTLGDKSIKVHRRHRKGICRRVVVATDCIVPNKHEANVPVRMEDDGLLLPPYDWATEPQGLGPACTLFSNSQPQLVARVVNNSLEDKLVSANGFLSMAEPVQCLSDDGHKPASLMFRGNRYQCDAMLSEESALPVSSSILSSQMYASETEFRTSSVSATTVKAPASGSSPPSSEGQQDHIESLLQRLPNKLTLNQKSSPNSVLDVRGPALLCHRRSMNVDAFARTPIGSKTRNLGRLCRKWQKRQFYNLRTFVPAAITTNARRTLCVGCAGPKTIGPLSHPTGDRCRRSAGLMMPDVLDTAEMPD